MDAFPRIEPLGEAALLARFADRLDGPANRAAIAFAADVAASPPDGVAEVAPSLGSVLVTMTDPARDAAALEAALRERLHVRDWSAVPAPGRRRWTVPCAFGGDDGPQLEEAAALAGRTPDTAVAEIVAAPLRVLAIGFAPGMPYLGILPPAWDIPRQTDLTPEVPEGALVVAVRQLVLFGTRAPTGWRQVGRTGFGCFRPERPRPVALAAGDELRLRPVGPAELEDLSAADPDGHGGASWEAVP